MTSRRTIPRFLLAGVLCAGMAAPAAADASIDGDVRVTTRKGHTFVVEADVTMSDKGRVFLEGEVLGKPFSYKKKFKTRRGRTKTKTVRFKVKLKKLKLRRLKTAATMSCTLSAAERGDVAPVEMPAGGVLPPPLVIVPGLGNELTPGAYDGFRDRLNAQMGGAYTTSGKRATLKVLTYPSLALGAETVDDVAKRIAKQTEKTIKRSSFERADVVAHSLGGLVVREAMLPKEGRKDRSLEGKVRHVFLMGVPNSGTPVAYLADRALVAADALGVDPGKLAEPLLERIDVPGAERFADLALTTDAHGAAELLLPTYAFADVRIGFGDRTMRADLETVTLGNDVPPLEDLNATAPDPRAQYHLLQYSMVPEAPPGEGTVTHVDLSEFLQSGATDLSVIGLIEGPGDGLVPLSSALMENHPAWAGRFQVMDLGMGRHAPTGDGMPAYWNDDAAIGHIVSFLR